MQERCRQQYANTIASQKKHLPHKQAVVRCDPGLVRKMHLEKAQTAASAKIIIISMHGEIKFANNALCFRKKEA